MGLNAQRFSLSRVRPNGSQGSAHEVVVHSAQDGSHEYLTCSCPGGRFAFAGSQAGRGCWAMQQVRAQLGWSGLVNQVH